MADNQLDILVKLGVIGKEDVKAVNDLMAETKQTTDKVSESTETANKHHGETRLVFTELNKIVPGLGHAMHAAFAGPLGPIILLGIAIKETQDKLKEYNAELDKVTESEVAEHQANIDRVKTAWTNAAVELGKYYAALETAGGEKDPIKKQLENIRAVTDAQLDSSKKIVEALGKQELAYARAHGGSPEQIAAIEERIRRETEGIDARKEYGDGLGELKQEQQTRAAQDAPLKAAAEKALAESARAKDNFEDNEAERANLESQLNPTTEAGQARLKKEQEAEAKLERAKNLPAGTMSGGTAPAVDNSIQNARMVKAAEEEIERNRKEREAIEKRLAQTAAEVTPLETAAESAQKKATAATGKSETNRARLNELPEEIDQAGKVESAKQHGREVVDAINTHGGKTNQSLGELAAAVKLTEQQKLNIVAGILNLTLSWQQVWAGLETRLAIQEQALANLKSTTHHAP